MPDYYGKRMSRPWNTVLRAADDAGVKFQVNSGRRTMADQWRLYREKGQWSPSNPTGAAYPSPTAPHIRVGRADHAIDVDTLTPPGGQNNLAAWLRQQGVTVVFPVPGEPWHIEVRGGLRRAARRIRKRQKRRKR